MRRTIPVLLGLTVLLSYFVAQSGAQTAKPEPGCAGVAATDATGDAVDPFTEDAAPPNMDITRFWFDRAGGKTYANLQVKSLDESIPDDSTGVVWYVVWETDALHYVSASSDGSAVTFEYGDYDADLGSYSTTGETTGQLFKGADGVIQMVVPADIGGKLGTKFNGPYANATQAASLPIVGGFVFTDDAAPDEGGGKAYTVADCPAGGGGGGGTATPTPTPTGSASPTPTPSGGGGGGGGGGSTPTPAVGTGRLNVKASSSAGSAKKASRKRKASVTLTGQATKISAVLYKGSAAKPKTYGKGSIAKVSGKARLKLKITRKVKKGRYTLTLIGTNPDGQRATRSFKVKFKR